MEWIMSWKSNSSQASPTVTVRCLGGTSLGAFLPPSLPSLRHMKIIVVGFRMLQMSHLKCSIEAMMNKKTGTRMCPHVLVNGDCYASISPQMMWHGAWRLV